MQARTLVQGPFEGLIERLICRSVTSIKIDG